jgi:hypothetical protein
MPEGMSLSLSITQWRLQEQVNLGTKWRSVIDSKPVIQQTIRWRLSAARYRCSSEQALLLLGTALWLYWQSYLNDVQLYGQDIDGTCLQNNTQLYKSLCAVKENETIKTKTKNTSPK